MDANELVDSMCMMSHPPRSITNIEDVPFEIKVNKNRRVRARGGRPKFKKAASESVLVTVLEKQVAYHNNKNYRSCIILGFLT